MRTTLLSLLLLGSFFELSRADDSEVFADGSTLIPLKNTKVELKKEILTLKYTGKRFAVDVYFEFNNTDKEHTETVGFVTPPSMVAAGDEAHPLLITPPDIRAFTVIMNYDTLSYTLAKFEKSGFRVPKKVAADIQGWDYLYYFKAHFKPGLNIIHHTYTIGTISNEVYAMEVKYRLTTGKNWANSAMEDFTLNIDMGDGAFFFLPTTFWNDKHQIDWKLTATGRVFKPSPFIVSEYDTIHGTQFVKTQSGVVIFHAMNFKPDYDLYLGKYYSEPTSHYWREDGVVDSLMEKAGFYDFANFIQEYRPSDTESYNRLSSFITSDLKRYSDTIVQLLKNGLFAMHDCSFKNAAITAQFKPYVWYMPVADRLPDMAILTEGEKKLMLFIAAEEKRRGKR